MGVAQTFGAHMWQWREGLNAPSDKSIEQLLQTSVSLRGVLGANFYDASLYGRNPWLRDWFEDISWEIQILSDFSHGPLASLGWCFTAHCVLGAALILGEEFPKLCTSWQEAAKFPC